MSDVSRPRRLPPHRRSDWPWRIVLVAAVAGVALRLAFSLLYWTGQPLTRDELEYLSLARSLAAGEGFVYDAAHRATGVETFGRAPGYPAWLALIGGGAHVATSAPTAVKVAQSIFGALGIWMVALLAFRMAGRRAAIAAAVISAAYPPLVWVSGYALSEALFWPIGLLVAWQFDRVLERPHRLAPALLCGVLAGIGILIRPALTFMMPLAAVLLLMRRQPLALAGLVLGSALVVSPWTARNVLHHGRLLFVASDGGVTFWTGNHPLAFGEGDMAANPPIKLDNLRFRAAHPGLNEEEAEPLYYREAFAWIRDNPLQWVSLEFKKLFYLVVPIGPSYTLHSTRYYALTLLSYLPVLALAIVALVRTRAHVPAPGLWLLTISSVLVALVFFPQERFRIPVIDPALIILSGVALATFMSGSRRA